jgi:hypothetical protein
MSFKISGIDTLVEVNCGLIVDRQSSGASRPDIARGVHRTLRRALHDEGSVEEAEQRVEEN